MRRVLIGLIVGALVFGVAFAGAKLATVTNPMTSELDANGYSILDVGSVTFRGFPTGTSGIYECPADPSSGPGVTAGSGSICLRDLGFDGGQLWLKIGLSPTDWTRVAGTP